MTIEEDNAKAKRIRDLL